MGVMCSLLGHDYGDPDVERERDENGREVVLTAKRVERCRSCGHERTLSENTEVTALSATAGVVRESDGTVVATPNEPNAGDVAVGDPSETSPPHDGSEPGPTNAPRDPEVEQRNRAGDARNERAESVRTPPEADGGADARGTGGSPDGSDADGGAIADAVTPGSALSRPADGTVRAGVDEPHGPDETAIDRVHDEPTHRDRPHRKPGEWPAEPERTTHGLTAGSHASNAGSSGGSVASRASWPRGTDAAGTVTADSADDETGTESRTHEQIGSDRSTGDSFACASCGFTTAVADSPLRAGDICPGCHHGYLARETRKG